ncbi:hypothetical protein [Chondromyces crocatus]|uniref:Uncharacterized protein n=1 Tax=Chondromyces crocatus TaxID=52 RepID=A0A0K1EIF1_CHOCO|nr:hypothetical protein [Chondromyces crocatus]AKT40373.1 uncharacterized protein CMC5_045260 [Chondromyces crocatus]
MRTIQLTSSLITFWSDVVFLEAALRATPETEALAAPVTEVLDDFPKILQRDLNTRRGVLQESARGSVADASLDTGIRQLFNGVLHLVGQNRKRAEFTTLFNEHIGAVVRHALRKQIDVADGLVGKLAVKIYPDDFRTRFVELLRPLVAHGRSVIEAQRQAEVGRVDGRIDVKAWKEEVNAIRLSVYAQLLTIASQTGRKRSWAEVFFLRSPTRKPAGSDEPDDIIDEDDDEDPPEPQT